MEKMAFNIPLTSKKTGMKLLILNVSSWGYSSFSYVVLLGSPLCLCFTGYVCCTAQSLQSGLTAPMIYLFSYVSFFFLLFFAALTVILFDVYASDQQLWATLHIPLGLHQTITSRRQTRTQQVHTWPSRTCWFICNWKCVCWNIEVSVCTTCYH